MFNACFEVSSSTAHIRGQATNFADTTFAKQESVVDTLCKVKSVKATSFITLFLEITKSEEYVMYGLP
jgi:hypothetical protein